MPRQLHPVLIEVAAAINSTLVVEEVLGRIVEASARAVAAKGCSLLLLTPDHTRFDYAASCGLSSRYTGKGPIRADVRSAALLAGQPQFARIHTAARAAGNRGSDTDSLQYPEAAAEEGIAAIYSVPLRFRGEVMGILRLYRSEARPFTSRECSLLAGVADLAAIAIENARSHEALRREVDDARQEMLEWYAHLKDRPQAAAQPPAFAHPSEEEFARLLDFYRVRWQYEPRSFPLQWDGDRMIEMFTPDFYLPDHDLYIELTTLRQKLVTYKNRKLRQLRALYPDVSVRLLYRKDYHRLLAKYGYRPVGEEEQAADVARVLFTPAQIHDRIKEIGAEISHEYADRNPLLVGVLKGVVVFMADLMRSLSVPCEVDFMAISSYGSGAQETVRIRKELGRSIAGRHVIVVEDIIDTGMTLTYLLNYLRKANPASLEVCTLLDKRARRLVPVPIKYTAFEVPDAFVVGYGLDYQEAYRQLPFIGVLHGDGSEHDHERELALPLSLSTSRTGLTPAPLHTAV